MKHGVFKKIKLFLVIVLFTPTVFFIPTLTGAALVQGDISPLNQNLTRGLIGWWTFDGGDTVSGSSIPYSFIDKSGSGNTATSSASGITVASGKVGQGVVFNGTTSRIKTLPSAGFAGLSAMAISVWVKNKIAPAVESYIFTKWYGNGSTVFLLAEESNGTVIYGNSANCSNPARPAQSTVAINDGKWHHIVGNFDGSYNYIYIDGVLSAQTVSGGPLCNSNVQPQVIGQLGTDANNYFNGTIDELRVYNRALSANEIYNLYKYGSSKQQVNSPAVSIQGTMNGLVGWWTFDGKDMTATTAFDMSGYANHGTLTSSPTVASGKIGQALSLNGTASYVDAGAGSSLSVSTVTMCAWIYSNTGPTASWQSLMAKRKDSLGTPHAYGMNFITGTGLQVYTSGTSGIKAFAYTIPAKKWTHLCGVISSSPTALYVNGALFGTSGAGGGAATNAANFKIGKSSDDGANTEYFNGLEDDVRIYNRALSANEIYNIYQYGASKQQVNSPAVSAQSTKNSLVGWWTLDGSNIYGNTAADLSGQNRNGTITGTSRVAGKIGQALRFNGTSDQIVVSPGVGTVTTATTFAAWIYVTPGAGAGIPFRGKYYFLQYIAGFFRVRFDCLSSGGAKVADTGQVQQGRWYHVVGTYNATDNQLKIYLNGALVATTNPGYSPCDAGTSYIGSGGGSNYFSGAVDDLRAYDRTLSANEVYSLYKYGR